MNDDFLIKSGTTTLKNLPVHLEHMQSTGNYQFYFKPQKIWKFEDVTIYINGYILPGINIFESFSSFKQHELVYQLYKTYKWDFISHIKGFFCIIIVIRDTIKIFTDQLGLFKLFYKEQNGKFSCSNSVKLLSACYDNLNYNPVMMAVKSLLNHEINGNTIFKDLHYTQPATEITLENGSIRFNTYFNYGTLIKNEPENKSYQYFASCLKEMVNQYNTYLRPERSVVSLTGGKDSRTVLSALMSNDISPVGITYGTPDSRDAVYSKLLSAKAGIEHYIFNPDKSVEWFEDTAIKIIGTGNPLINIHRGHRYNAFLEMSERIGKNIAYYGGYMGGEFLMGVYYDNLIFTNYLTNQWEKKPAKNKEIQNLLAVYFFQNDSIDAKSIREELSRLRALNLSANKVQRQFHGLFEIGIQHHSQDLFLLYRCNNYPLAVFLDLDFIHELFSSNYSFIYRNNKTKNLFRRYDLYEFNLNVQHILYPLFDAIPFAKRGSYNTKEFLKGKLYWSLVKSWRYLSEEKKYPPSFGYNNEYRLFLIKWLNEIRLDKASNIHAVYNIHEAIKSISNSPILTAEKQLLAYSFIVMHYLQLKYMQK